MKKYFIKDWFTKPFGHVINASLNYAANRISLFFYLLYFLIHFQCALTMRTSNIGVFLLSVRFNNEFSFLLNFCICNFFENYDYKKKITVFLILLFRYLMLSYSIDPCCKIYAIFWCKVLFCKCARYYSTFLYE